MAFDDTKGEHGGGNGGGKTRKKKNAAAGRKDAEKQDAVIECAVIKTRINQLVRLKNAADEASQDLNDAITKAAEDSGLLSSTVRRFVTARAGEDFEGAKRKVAQLALVFEEVGE